MAVVNGHVLKLYLPHIFDPDPGTLHELGEAFLARIPIVNLLFHGQAAVTLFFVLSGYVLMRAFDARQTWGDAISRTLKRYPRLAITMLVSGLFCSALSYLGLFTYYAEAQKISHSNMYDPYGALISVGLVLRTCLWDTFTQPGFPPVNPAYWTMRIELIGSIFIFVLSALRVTKMDCLLAAVVFAAILGEPLYLCFGLGACLRLWFEQRPLFRVANLPGWSVFLFGAFCLSYPYFSIEGTAWDFAAFIPASNRDVYFRIVGATLLVAVAISWPPLVWLLGRPLPKFLGRVSFSTYLIHFPIVFSLGGAVFIVAAAHIGYLGSVVFSLGIVAVASLSAAYVLTKLVDEPVIRTLGKIGRCKPSLRNADSIPAARAV